MKSILDIIEKMPYVCEAEDPERYVVPARMAYFIERGGNSVYDRKESDKLQPGRRLRIFFAFKAGPHHEGKTKQFERLLAIWEISHYEKDHGESGFEDLKQNLITEAAMEESKYPEVAEVLTVEEAVANYGW